jgi:MFS family permease
MLSHLIAPWLARRNIHYGWLVVAVTFLTMLATSACMGLPGVLIIPLRTEFGWETGEISAALGLRLALYGLVGVFAAALMQRYGVRTVICTALVLIMTGLGLAAAMTDLWQLWVTWGLIVGIATGMTAMVLAATVANRWFTARRGLVLGMLAASTATGQLVFLPAAAWLASNLGWRMAVVPAIAACGICFVLVLLIMRDHPGELGLAPYGEAAVIPPPPRASAGVARLSQAALTDASGSRAFWLLFLTFFICGLSTNGIVQNHFIPLCFDFGMPEVAAASVLAIMGIFDFMGTIGSGWLSDRYDNRWLLFWYYAGRGISLVVLPFSTFSVYGLSVFAVFFGLDFIAKLLKNWWHAGAACLEPRF